MCTCKGKDKKPVDKQWKEKMQRVYERGIKQINMVDMANKETRKQANKREGKQARKQSNKQKGKQARKRAKGGVPEGKM